MTDPQRRVAERRALQALDAVYRDVESLQAGWGCARSGECCQLAKTGREPYAWTVEWLRVRAALERSGRPIPPAREDGACPLLNETGGCSIYADRPLGCRTFFCERGHGPKKITREMITARMVKVEALAQMLEPDESAPRRLVDWLREAAHAP